MFLDVPFQLSVLFHEKMFKNIISIVKKNTASKKFTATKNDVLFDAFEVTYVFPLSHDTKIAVTLVQSYSGSDSYRFRCPYVTHLS